MLSTFMFTQEVVFVLPRNINDNNDKKSSLLDMFSLLDNSSELSVHEIDRYIDFGKSVQSD